MGLRVATPASQDPGRRGQAEEAEALGRRAIELSRQMDYVEVRGDVLMDMAEVMELSGRPAEAAPYIREALRLYERKGNVVSAARARSLLEGNRSTAGPVPAPD